MDNEEFESLKKDAELKKLNKEIAKIEAETEEIISKRGSAWAPAVIAICSVFIVYLNGCLTDSKSKLVQEETKNLKVKNDKSRVIFHRDSLALISQKDKIQRQLDSLSQKFIQDKTKFDKERVKYDYMISRKEKEIGGLKNEKNILSSEVSKVENCFPKAKEFLLKYCVKTNVSGMSIDSIMRMISPPPYKTRFNKPLREIAKMDISKMNYIQFLQITANFKIISMGNVRTDIVSEDGLVQVIKDVNGGILTPRQAPAIMADITSKFECYKNLSINQKLKLLNEVTRSIN